MYVYSWRWGCSRIRNFSLNGSLEILTQAINVYMIYVYIIYVSKYYLCAKLVLLFMRLSCPYMYTLFAFVQHVNFYRREIRRFYRVFWHSRWENIFGVFYNYLILYAFISDEKGGKKLSCFHIISVVTKEEKNHRVGSNYTIKNSRKLVASLPSRLSKMKLIRTNLISAAIYGVGGCRRFSGVRILLIHKRNVIGAWFDFVLLKRAGFQVFTMDSCDGFMICRKM